MLVTHKSNEIHLEAFIAHALLDVIVGRAGDSLGVDLESLGMWSAVSLSTVWCAVFTSRKSSISLSSLAAFIMAHASSGILSGMLLRSNLRLEVQSLAW